MTKILGGLLVMVLGASCAGLFPETAGPVPVRERVVSSWRGRPTIDVEAHPYFSSMKPEKQDLSDGSQILHFLNCIDWQEASTTTRAGGPAYSVEETEAGKKGQTCCDRQFLIREGKVSEYRQVPRGGTCNWDLQYAAR